MLFYVAFFFKLSFKSLALIFNIWNSVLCQHYAKCMATIITTSRSLYCEGSSPLSQIAGKASYSVLIVVTLSAEALPRNGRIWMYDLADRPSTVAIYGRHTEWKLSAKKR